MKLGELINQWKDLDPELEVYVSSNSEGDNIKEFEGWASGYWNEEDEEFVAESDANDYWMAQLEEGLEVQTGPPNALTLFPY